MTENSSAPPPFGPGEHWSTPPQQHPDYRYAPPPGYPSPPGYPPPPSASWSPRRGRRRGLAAVAAATVIAATVIAAAVTLRPAGGTSPAGVVDAYLHALANGDASTALSLGVATASSTVLLSDDVLKQQIHKLPITDIRVEGETKTPSTTADRVYVKASAAFGGRRSDSDIEVVRSGDEWKLGSAFVNAHDPGHGIGGDLGRAFDSLQIFGQPVGNSGTVAMFPGALTVSSSNPFLNVQPPAPILLKGLEAGDQATSFSPVFSLNDAGKAAIQTTIINWVTACYTPGAPPAGPCDKIDPTMGGAYVPGTARLTGPLSFGQWSYELDQSLRVLVTNESANIPFSAQRPDGSTEDRVWFQISTSVDISSNPPVVIAP
jgi:hypothetical protein